MTKIKNRIIKIYSFLQSVENKPYIFSRFVSVSIKPLMLFICILFQLKEFGSIIAMLFLVSSVTITFSSIPIFRNFYLNLNNKSTLKRDYFRNKYKSEIIILFLLSLIFLIPLNKFFENNIEILICTILVFSIDKIYDEIQRLLIVKKKFNEWSVITNFKNITLIIFFLNPLINVNIIFLGIIYFITNFLRQFVYLKISINLNFKKQIKGFLLSLWSNKKIYIMNYLLVFYTIGDKIVVGKTFNKDLPEFLLLGNILSIPLLFINFFYISRYRAEFVKNLISLKNVLLSKKFNYLLISTFFCIFIFLIFYSVMEISNFSTQTLILLFLIYIINSYNLILDEIVYWKSFYKDFLTFEIVFFILFLLISYCTIYLNINLESFLVCIFLLFLFKIVFKITIYNKKKNNIKN